MGGRTSPVHQPAGLELPQPVERRNSGRLGSQPHHPQYSSAYTRPRLRDKSPRSEDLEADDEQGDKTDNDHDSLNLSESSSVTTVREEQRRLQRVNQELLAALSLRSKDA